MFRNLYQKIINLSKANNAIYYLALLSFAEASVLPLPPDFMLTAMNIASPHKAWLFAAVTTLSSVLGSIIGYLLGLIAYKSLVLPLIIYFNYDLQYQHVVSWFADYGMWVVLFASFTPIPYKLFTLSAGSMQLHFLPFIGISFISRGLRFFLVSGIFKFFARSRNAVS